MERTVTVACVQAEPVILDREATVDKLAALAAEAAGEGRAAARLPRGVHPRLPVVCLGEGARRLGRPRGRRRRSRCSRASRSRCRAPAADRLGEIARENGVWLVTGVTEIDPERPGTLYNTLLYHAPDGKLAQRHRKLVPTNHERLVWGQGDGGGLRAIPTELGRIGGLICWENYMPLARFALYESGVEIYIASTADDGGRLAGDARPHRARVARVRRRAVATSSGPRRTLTDFPLARADRRASTSSAAAAARSSRPDGAYLAGPLYDEEGILYAELDPARLVRERQRFDPAGHYHRPGRAAAHGRDG